MIRILKQGKLPMKKITWYKLKCKNCGTIFCATDRETRIYYLKYSISAEFNCPICEEHNFIENYSKDNFLVLPEGEEPKEEPITAEDKLYNHLKGVAVGLSEKDKIFANYQLVYKKLTSKDEHCPICGKECKTLYDGIIDSYGANARYCSLCDHIFYIGEEQEEKDEKNIL